MGQNKFPFNIAMENDLYRSQKPLELVIFNSSSRLLYQILSGIKWIYPDWSRIPDSHQAWGITGMAQLGRGRLSAPQAKNSHAGRRGSVSPKPLLPRARRTNDLLWKAGDRAARRVWETWGIHSTETWEENMNPAKKKRKTWVLWQDLKQITRQNGSSTKQ